MIYSIRDLRYYLVEGEAPWLDNFQVLDQRYLEWHEVKATVYALCTSHAVSVYWQGKHITELLSCRGHLNMDPVVAEIGTNQPFEMATNIHGLHYRFLLTPQSLIGNDGLKGSFPLENKISVTYPKIPDLETPVTLIGWEVNPGTLRIETLHTYPENAKGVRSESLFDFTRND
jgi:Protein of unknown function DUF2617